MSRTIYKTILFFLTSFIVTNSYSQNFSVKGTVTTSDGKPAAGVNIQLTETRQTFITAENGTFQFSNLASGKYNLLVSYAGLATQAKSFVTAPQNIQQTINFVLQENYTELTEIIVAASKEKMVAIGKLSIKPMDLPQATAVVGQQVLEHQQVQTLGDVVQNLNGVYVMGNAGGYQEELASRGYAFGSNNTFKNGVRFNNSMMPEVSGLESVEVLKGGNAILFGTVGAGGVLNIITKKPKFNQGGNIRFQTGSYDFYKPVIDIYGAINNSKHVAYRINSSFTKAGSFRDNVKSQRFYINPSFLVKIGNKTDVLIEADYTQDNRNLDFGTGAINYKIANTARSLYLNLPWSYNNADQVSATSAITHRLSDNWQLKSVLSTRKFNYEQFGATRPNAGGQFIDSTPANYGRWLRGLVKNKNIENYSFGSLDITGKFKTGSLQHTLLAGIDADITKTKVYRYDYTTYRADKKNIYDTVNIFDTQQYTPRNDIPDVPWNLHTNAPVSRVGIYLQDFAEISSKLKVLAGIRYSFSKTGMLDSIYADGKTLLHSEGRNDDAFSPRFGVMYQPAKNISVFGSYTNTYELNTAIDTFGNVLRPSIIDQFELGVKTLLFGNLLSLNATGYIINNNNALQSYPNLSPGDSRRESGGQTKSQGVEIDIETKNISGFKINAGYSYNDTRYTKSTLYESGSRLRYNPGHTANLHAFYSVKPTSKLGGLQAGLGIYYVGQRVAGRNATKANPQYRLLTIPDYFLFDASLGYTCQNVTLRFKVNNILNQLSYNVHDDNSVNPIAPRQFTATASYSF